MATLLNRASTLLLMGLLLGLGLAGCRAEPSASWVKLGPRDVTVHALALSPAYPQDRTLFIGTDRGGVYRSTEGGKSWRQVYTGHRSILVRKLAVSPDYRQDGTLFAMTQFYGPYFEVHRSTDLGKSWQRVKAGDGYANVLALSPHYPQDRTLFIGTDRGGVFRSNDGGDSWQQVNNGLTDPYLQIQALALSPDFPRDRTLFASTWQSGIYRSTDEGGSWQKVSDPLTLPGFDVLALSLDYANDRTLFAAYSGAGTPDTGVFRSTDAGASWQQVNNGLRDAQIQALVLSPDYPNDRTLFVAAETAVAPYGRVFRSNDGGDSWQQVNNGLGNVGVTSLALSPGHLQDRALFVGTNVDGVFRLTESAP